MGNVAASLLPGRRVLDRAGGPYLYLYGASSGSRRLRIRLRRRKLGPIYQRRDSDTIRRTASRTDSLPGSPWRTATCSGRKDRSGR